ncbi:GntR family transcriptional regulator [Jiella avicenniae]|uniref:GntR family transcriptional regulator n=1 Tax=Jiella avicenniae TaxID=2907202 RepID=A0A9X1T5C3_9HYPH|nr:GntR family transcriptional regulator [Jiella avicenniae]MCE7029486.1 GntR family transcriptional regulator [Jiella avicenniae]
MQGIERFAPTHMPTLRQQTADVLREALMTEMFHPGEKLVERSLAERTGVSRTSIREALSQLEAEGLVTRIPGKGVSVTRLSPRNVREIYEARVVLETSMARFFVERASAEHIAALEAAVAEAEATNRPDQAREHASKLDDVADIITQGADNEVMRQLAFVLRTRMTYLRTITARVATSERRQETMRRLNAIAASLKARDAETAMRLTREYVERSAEFAVATLQSMETKTTRASAASPKDTMP